jgi:CheY-like chemotaxis protein
MSDHEKLQVLHVEDNAAHADLVKRMLTKDRSDVTLIQFPDGEAALHYLRKGAQPKLILLDLRLPKIDGLDVLRQIKDSEETWRLPVVILSTSSAGEDMRAAYRNGANGYLIKPLDFEQFREMIVSLCHFWLDWNVESA